MEVLRREFKSYTDDKVDLDIMLIKVQIQIQDSAIKTFFSTRSFLFLHSFEIRFGIYKDGVQGNKNYVLGAALETNTLPGYMSTLYNHDDPFAVCVVRNSIVKMNPGNLRILVLEDKYNFSPT